MGTNFAYRGQYFYRIENGNVNFDSPSYGSAVCQVALGNARINASTFAATSSHIHSDITSVIVYIEYGSLAFSHTKTCILAITNEGDSRKINRRNEHLLRIYCLIKKRLHESVK